MLAHRPSVRPRRRSLSTALTQERCWPRAQPIKIKKSWVRRLLETPLHIEPPQQNSPWLVCGELAVDIGGPYPIEQRWWDAKQTEHEYLIRVQSGRILWVLCDQQTNLWRVIGWVA